MYRKNLRVYFKQLSKCDLRMTNRVGRKRKMKQETGFPQTKENSKL